jgi:hypothetical protein
MIQRLLRLASVAAFCALVTPVTTLAQEGTVVDWGPDGYAYETSYNNATYISAPGSQLFIVGIVNGFLGSLSGFNPNTPGTEYTFYIHGLTPATGLTSTGTIITPGTFANTYRTAYAGGAFEIYEDSPRDAAFGTNPPNGTVPSSFTDGTLFLSGVFDSLIVTFAKQNSNNLVLGGNFDTGEPATGGRFTGGREIARVSVGGRPCPMRITGGWLARPGNFPLGYSAHPDGKWDIDCPTADQPSTWGKVKAQYRD